MSEQRTSQLIADKEMPDFSVPRPGCRKTEVQGETLYLPRGLSFNSCGLWRSTHANKQRYFKTLEEAWRDLSQREEVDSRPWYPAPTGPRKRLDTGIIGVVISICWKNGKLRVVVTTAQSLTTGYRAVEGEIIEASDLTQQWLDARLCEAAAIRWHYVRLRKEKKPSKPVRLEDVPPGSIPRTPVKRVDVSEVFEAIDQHRAKTKKG
ncbi:MAG: hypothetical protein SWN10_13455 [Pseudomonadota bacterium]|nr:hypothetical protein [Pseudomonadota bacterium]